MWTLKRICSLELAAGSDPREGSPSNAFHSVEWEEGMHSNLIQSNNLPTHFLGSWEFWVDCLRNEFFVPFLFSVLPSTLTDTKVVWEKVGGASSSHIPMRPL